MAFNKSPSISSDLFKYGKHRIMSQLGNAHGSNIHTAAYCTKSNRYSKASRDADREDFAYSLESVAFYYGIRFNVSNATL